jgi:hypothetical protein
LSDLDGASDALISILNVPAGTATNGKGAGVAVGIGTLSTIVVGRAQRSNPFCNSADANSGTPATSSYGGVADLQDLDPVRTLCGTSVPQGETACEATANFALAGSGNRGDLGIVLPITLPRGGAVTSTIDLYPTTACSTSCTLVAVSSGSHIPTGFKCPGGGSTIAGACYMPYFNNAGDLDPRCITSRATRCVGSAGAVDGRSYNLPVIVPSSRFTGGNLAPLHGSKEYQFAVDSNLRIFNKSFFRIHETTTSPLYSAGIGSETGTTGLCTENEDTRQIGCLADAEPCSVGFAAREAARGYPGLAGTPPTPTEQPLKALAVNGTPPFTPDSVAIPIVGHSDPDLAVRNLRTAGTPSPLYPLARRLYVNTIYGFVSLLNGERELAECFGADSIVSPAMLAHDYVPIPDGPCCVDYPETKGLPTPPANINGSDSLALGGCASSSNTNACNPPLPLPVGSAATLRTCP